MSASLHQVKDTRRRYHAAMDELERLGVEIAKAKEEKLLRENRALALLGVVELQARCAEITAEYVLAF